MGGPTKVYLVLPAAGVAGDDFERFMRDEVLPAVERGPTRVGGIGAMRLYRAAGEPREEYIWLIEWSGLAQAVDTLAGAAFAALKAAGAEVRPAGEWLPVITEDE